MEISLKEVHKIFGDFLDEEQRVALVRRDLFVGFHMHIANLPNYLLSS